MDSQPVPAFKWISPLGISVMLFLVYGLVYIVIGALTPVMQNRGIGSQILIISTRTDGLVFGQPPVDLLRDDPALASLRTILLNIIGGLLFAAGCFHLTITWFGLRQGQAWALIALAIGGLTVLPFYFVALRPYFQPGINLALSDMPPFMWIPAVLLLPAVALGWLGLSIYP